jgi:hypothetical protein
MGGLFLPMDANRTYIKGQTMKKYEKDPMQDKIP